MVGPASTRQGRSKLAIEASPSGVLVVDPEGKIVLLNRELERQFGYARETSSSGRSSICWCRRRCARSRRARDGFVQAPESRPLGAGRELVARRKDGSQFPVEIGLTPSADVEWPLRPGVHRGHHRTAPVGGRRTGPRSKSSSRSNGSSPSCPRQFINLPAEHINDAITGRPPPNLRADRLSIAARSPRSAADGVLARRRELDGAWRSQRWMTLSSRCTTRRGRSSRSAPARSSSSPASARCPQETDRAAYLAAGTRSAVIVPLWVEGRVEGAVGFQCHAGRADVVGGGRPSAHRDRERVRRDPGEETARRGGAARPRPKRSA